MAVKIEIIPENELDILQENPIFLVGFPESIFSTEIQRILERIRTAPKDQQRYVEAGIRAACELQYQ